ncbi:sigma-70 family RNA polymerase sigma factor [Luteolibacter sp. GHJ8]|uniref:Sigma-70 family RNA polymerase sigma factor n=1 Tax=Luteolibacter rhizosphaerae TaxID=2989719 RepID=A0ABT3G227_9BACT|nr:sigma-70 family RNA polymerase sigma factor [Luteolibacter rhizosphaerae]MCW1913576.1 sigma-70 family RNA polymerase sigma factor [Luteolibacter rhizosphaerae]
MTATHSPLFPVTQWTLLVNGCRAQDPELRRRSLEELCRAYWYPLYVFARRQGVGCEDAEDLTQGFFHYLLEKNLFASASQDLGKLRTFLLTIFQRYIGDVRDRDRALKRGGGQTLISLDLREGEERYANEPADPLTPEALYDRSWAMALLAKSLQELGKAEGLAGREPHFKVLEPFLNASAVAEGSYETAARALGMNQEAVRKAVSRLRRKFRDALREQIAATLHEPDEHQVDEELMALRDALRG